MTINRYDKADTRILGRHALRAPGTEVFATQLPLKVEPADDDGIITAGDGDRLDQLAARFYGHPSLWYVIASVNNLANGSMHVRPGTQLRIPSLLRVI